MFDVFLKKWVYNSVGFSQRTIIMKIINNSRNMQLTLSTMVTRAYYISIALVLCKNLRVVNDMVWKNYGVMRWSIRNFNIPPPPDIPQAYLVPREEGISTLRWKGGQFEPYLLFWRNTPLSFFRFLQEFDGLQDRISPLLVNNSFKRIFKWSLKVSLRLISLWKMCKVFDWRRNLSLRRGSSVLIGGAFEWLFCTEGREFEQANLQKFKCPGGCPGGVPRGGRMLNFRIDRRISHTRVWNGSTQI